MRRVIAKAETLKHDTVGLSDAEILKKLGVRHHSGEGLFYPDTYMFKKGASDMQVYRRAYDAQMARLNALWANRDLRLPYKTPYDALIMASLIEKETADPDDREMIAGVFLNRLRIGMKLQTDPTVIYGMGHGYRGKIRKADLLRDTPYNTYTAMACRRLRLLCREKRRWKRHSIRLPPMPFILWRVAMEPASFPVTLTTIIRPSGISF